jgi:undecaprenyl diphosphate synthase
MALPQSVDVQNLPQHVAIIMDGNGRWARQHGKVRTFGHRHGVEAVRDTTEGAAELGIKYLTLYAFSTENWNRPRIEINALMELLIHTISKETKTLIDNNIRLQAIGDIGSLPKSCVKALRQSMETTAGNTRMTLVLALSYSSRWEITEAVRNILRASEKKRIDPETVTEQFFASHLATAGIPDPELLIRTSGEYRVSNFLLWQIAYSELYFTPKFWPDFRRQDLFEAISAYQKRERRFGEVKN